MTGRARIIIVSGRSNLSGPGGCKPLGEGQGAKLQLQQVKSPEVEAFLVLASLQSNFNRFVA